MHHKRKRPPSARAGCHMCKPQKGGKANPDTDIYHRGFGKIRDLIHSKQDMREVF